MATAWKILLVLIGSALALYLLGMLLVMAVFVVPAVLGSFDAWENDQQVYLRNRIGTPLQVALTVPRKALGVDTVWWGITTHGTAVVRAAVVRKLYVPGLRPNLTAPALLGPVDTLVAAGFEMQMQYLGKHRTFNWYYKDMDLWMARAKQPRPALNAAMRVLPLPTQPDSVRLVFSVAPDSLLWAATVNTGFRHSDPDESWIKHDGPNLMVSWRDQTGQLHRQPFPTGYWFDTMQRIADQRGGLDYHLTHYADYR
ncbi:MAG: hypothetical protein ACRYFR_13145 [Janthinobacterium lividum]